MWNWNEEQCVTISICRHQLIVLPNKIAWLFLHVSTSMHENGFMIFLCSHDAYPASCWIWGATLGSEIWFRKSAIIAGSHHANHTYFCSGWMNIHFCWGMWKWVKEQAGRPLPFMGCHPTDYVVMMLLISFVLIGSVNLVSLMQLIEFLYLFLRGFCIEHPSCSVLKVSGPDWQTLQRMSVILKLWRQKSVT